jgi:hypothetical protein
MLILTHHLRTPYSDFCLDPRLATRNLDLDLDMGLDSCLTLTRTNLNFDLNMDLDSNQVFRHG